MDMNQIVGKRIASILDNKGWTQVKLANKLGVSRQIVNNIIQGKKNITIAEVNNIANILGVNVDDLTKSFGKEEKPEPIMAFMGQVDTAEAQKGLKKAEDIMELIIFHEDTKEAFDEMMS